MRAYTNNDVERWHHKLNTRTMKKKQPSFYLLIILYSEAGNILNQVKPVNKGKLKQQQRKQAKQVQGSLMQLWDAYK